MIDPSDISILAGRMVIKREEVRTKEDAGVWVGIGGNNFRVTDLYNQARVIPIHRVPMAVLSV